MDDPAVKSNNDPFVQRIRKMVQRMKVVQGLGRGMGLAKVKAAHAQLGFYVA